MCAGISHQSSGLQTAPSNPSSGRRQLPLPVVAGWLFATCFCAWFEFTRVWQLALSPAGPLAWFATWNLDTSLPLVALAVLPLLFLLCRPSRKSSYLPDDHSGASLQGAREPGAPKSGVSSGSVSEKGAQKSGALLGPAPAKFSRPAHTLAIALLNLAVNASIGFRSIEVPANSPDTNLPRTATFHSLPHAYHDEFSYLLQAHTFLAGRVAWPAMTVGGDAFHQIHVLNRPVTASRYFPWTGIWIAPFLAVGMPIAGHWLASTLAVAIFHVLLKRITSPGAAFAGGLLLALCPGMAVFSNLLLAHQPTLLALAVFLLCFHNFQLTRRPLWTWLAGIALTCAMLGRPMTAAGFAAPCGIAFAADLFRHQSLTERKLALQSVAGFAIPLATGFLLLALLNSQITGHWNKSAYQLYTDTWTPRHRFGFNNALLPPQPGNVLATYDAWAENLTPRLALRNLHNRLLASSQWTLGIAALLAILPAACSSLFRPPRTQHPSGNQLLRLTACSVLSLHLVHIPYWYDGILHWHYVFETAPLLLLLTAAGLQQWFTALHPWLGRRAARNWIIALVASALLPSWLDTDAFWGSSRVSLAVSEQAFSRVRLEAFERIKQSLSRKQPCLILVDEQNTDQQLSYIINPPNFEAPAPALVARLPDTDSALSEIHNRFPKHLLWKFNPQTFSLQQLQIK